MIAQCLLDLPTEIIQHELFKSVLLTDFVKLRLVCTQLSHLPWNIPTRTVLYRRRFRTPSLLSTHARCVVNDCSNRRLTAIVWDELYVPQLPYCRLHVDPFVLREVDVYCYDSLVPSVITPPPGS